MTRVEIFVYHFAQQCLKFTSVARIAREPYGLSLGMEFIFGPVPLKHLRQSLGVNTVSLKTCNWNCVYCQLSRSRPVVNERRAYYLLRKILDEARLALANHKPGEISWVIPHINVIITNSTLLYVPDVRVALSKSDAVLPARDTGCEALYRQIDCLHSNLIFKRHLRKLIAFQRKYFGNLWGGNHACARPKGYRSGAATHRSERTCARVTRPTITPDAMLRRAIYKERLSVKVLFS